MADPRQHPYEDGLEVNRQGGDIEINDTVVANKLQALQANNIGPGFPVVRQSEPSGRNPWGLRPVAFGLLVGIVTAIVVGAAVGGGVAGSMTSRKDSWYD